MVIVGLGNPGNEYIGTRHNVGRELLLRLYDATKDSFTPWQEKTALKSTYATDRHGITLLLPQTYMNLSGEAVRLYADYFKVPTEEIVVVHDDLDLPLGAVKVSFDRSSAGHNGVESLIRSLGTSQFVRIRIGIALNEEDLRVRKLSDNWSGAQFVLGRFTSAEEEVVFGRDMLAYLSKLLRALSEKRLEDVMTEFNAKKKVSEH